MITQPEALQLADWARSYNTTMHNRCAAELRRLHAEVEELRGALDEAMWHVKYKELKAVNEELLQALCLAHDYLAGNGWDDDERINPIRAVIAAYQRKQEGKV